MKLLIIVLFLCIFIVISSLAQSVTFNPLSRNKSIETVTRCRRATITNKLTGDYTREESKAIKCEITVQDLSAKHPIFINEQSNVIIPIRGKLRFNLNDRFEVNCAQSKFANNVKAKTVECTGNNQYSVELNGKKVVTSFNDINKCNERVVLTPVKGIKCPGGDLMHMRFLLEPHGYFELYSSCYDDKSVSTIYNNYILYGKAPGKSITQVEDSSSEINL